jgi:hypothetical protein
MGEGRKRAWSDVKADFKSPTASATVCARADLFAEYEALRVRWEQAKEADTHLETAAEEPQAAKLAEQMQVLRGDMLASQVTFVFQGVGRRREQELLLQHPPTDEQQELAKRNGFHMLHNPDTYFPALAVEACVDPEGMTHEDWVSIYDEWTDGQTAPLRKAVFTVNKAGAEVPKDGTSSSDRED